MLRQDDAQNDPMYSDEQILASNFVVGGRSIGQAELDVMKTISAAVFEILEKVWASLDCVLVDSKIEFGVDSLTGQSSNFNLKKKTKFFKENVEKQANCWWRTSSTATPGGCGPLATRV